ncbi:fructosamine kinase family protein [Haloactinopolyspora alba]|uniref:fructosamine kinase family protein n=1 Tax=Haloactinopolyspora alba TaxID=648780 RepID=UPI00197A7986|nr:fructosamine kinase family protein [Haloactinopolyspora alba]
MSPVEADPLARLLDVPVASATSVGGGSICDARRARLSDGRTIFVKTRASAPAGFFSSEVNGLERLGAARQGAAVPRVLAHDDECLVLEWIATGVPSVQAAERFGRALAATHRHGADRFGSADGDGWIATLPLPGGPWESWPRMWVQGRIEPYLRMARKAGAIDKRSAADVERVIEDIDRLAGPAEPPSMLHGDLWAGNVLWAEDGTNYLIDPAAHGGHRETDLAMLALFGLPHLDRVLAAYHEASPLADGWRERTALHQLHPVLVHAVLFGGSYGAQAGQLARLALRGG